MYNNLNNKMYLQTTINISIVYGQYFHLLIRRGQKFYKIAKYTYYFRGRGNGKPIKCQ